MRIKQYITLGSIAALVFLLPFLLRFYQNRTLPGDISYYYFSAFPHLFPFSFAAQWLVNSSLTLVFLALVSFIIGGWDVSSEEQFFMMIFLIMSPATLYLSSQPTPYLYALLCIAASLALVTTHFSYLMVVPFAGLIFFDWTALVCGVAIVSAYTLFLNKKKFLFVPLATLLLFIIVHFLTPLSFIFAQLAERSFLIELFSDLGGAFGLSLFIFILSIIGFALTWKKKKEYIPLYVLSFLLFLLFVWSRAALLFFYPILSILAAHAFTYFWRREWTLPFVHILTIAVLSYGVLFSTLAYGTTLVYDPPSPELMTSVQWLHNHPFYNHDVVLSLPRNGFFNDYGSTAFVTPFSSVENVNITHTIFNSRDLKKTAGLLQSNNISIILIDDAMKRSLWNTDDDGLLFLFRTSGSFVKVYDTTGIEMWKFKD